MTAGREQLLFSKNNVTTSRLADVVDGENLNLDAVSARVLALPPTQPGETPYEGITCRLEAAARQRVPPVIAPTDERSASRSLRESLRRAVERALDGAQRVAVMTGGGLDSAGLLALALEWSKPRNASVFAVALDYAARCDDRPYLRIVEEALGVEVIRVQPEAGARHLAALNGVDCAPFPWPAGPMEAEMLARARGNGADCVLMGVGGDELFDGEPRALAAIARDGRIGEAIRRAHKLRGFETPRSKALTWLVRPILAKAIPNRLRVRLARRHPVSFPSWAGPALIEYVEQLHHRDVNRLASRLRHKTPPDPAIAECHQANNAWLRHHEEILGGVERRDPYMDRLLIEEVEHLKPEWLLQGDIRRGLFRAALADLLPAPVLQREDKAFFEPAFSRMVHACGGLESTRDLASMTELGALQLVNPQKFKRAFEEFVEAPGDPYAWMREWPALCVERFLRARRSERSRPH